MNKTYIRSEALFERSQRVIPGGVNSPVRAARSVGACPLFIARAEGSRIVDVDNQVYIDYVGSWGPMILGHAHPQVLEALTKAASLGTSYGAPTEAEVTLAEKIVASVPSVEKVRLVSSGTEATMSAVRLARAYTQRPVIVKFDGCYHGHGDSFLIKAGSGLATLGIPGSPGVPQEIAALTVSLPYNDLNSVQNLFNEKGRQIAALIVEPVAGNMGVVPPGPGFLEGLREITSQSGSLLIFDEVITGFRVALGGAQELFNILPDLTCLGKIIGGGLPVGAYGGREEIMSWIAPVGPVYQAGTLSGNPLATAAGLATLNLLSEKEVYPQLEEKSAFFFEKLEALARGQGLPLRVTRIGSMGSFFFTREAVTDFTTVQQASAEAYGQFFRAMRGRGVYLAPSAFEALFISLAHSQEDLEKTLAAAEKSFREIKF
ncbi:MAG TPA: glutamate-1-semialdehyde 2,1-aminomutase [Thermodesulfobacteriota bacterium]|nr:glutamate-1-semialdehyde 2,1-aminomutase [Thermodesulfobacteriota bacterium]